MTYHRDRPHDWRELAACADLDAASLDLFHGNADDQASATLLCRRTCPVVAQCAMLAEQLETATVEPLPTYGVWGGETAHERTYRRSRANRDRANCRACRRPMRRSHEAAAPGTVLRSSGGLCSGCYDRIRLQQVKTSRQKDTIAAQEAQYTAEQVARAAALYAAGDRSEWVVIGRRIRDRQQKRAERARLRQEAS